MKEGKKTWALGRERIAPVRPLTIEGMASEARPPPLVALGVLSSCDIFGDRTPAGGHVQ